LFPIIVIPIVALIFSIWYFFYLIKLAKVGNAVPFTNILTLLLILAPFVGWFWFVSTLNLNGIAW
jgi:hypothetical protein